MYPDSSISFLQIAMTAPKPALQVKVAGSWTFLSNHAHVLICLARDPDCRLRDVAQQVGITERATYNILAELEVAGVVSHVRVGRRNRYALNLDASLRHPLEEDRTLASLLKGLLTPAEFRRIETF